MRLRRALWRTMGPSAGSLAPRAARAYYDLVTRSLAAALGRDDSVVALYAYGSYATGELRPGRSDVDLLCVVERADDETLARLRRLYTRRQAILPLGLSVLERNEFDRGAGWLSWARTRIDDARPLSPVVEWRLLAGEDLRRQRPWQPDGDLWYITEAHVAEAIATQSRARLELLAADLERVGLDGAALRRGTLVDALAVAMEITERHRRRTARAPLRTTTSTTRLLLPFEPEPLLLLEAPDARSARPHLERALELRRAEGARVHVTTTLLAEDSWRSGLRWLALRDADHVDGEPLFPRVHTPAVETRKLLLEARRWAVVGRERRAIVGMRGVTRDPDFHARLALLDSLVDQQDVLVAQAFAVD